MKHRLAVLILGLTLLAPGLAAAQSATPAATQAPPGRQMLATATPLATPTRSTDGCNALLCGAAGQLDAANREFNADGLNLLGLAIIGANVTRFDSPQHAESAMKSIPGNLTPWLNTRLSGPSDAFDVVETSVREIGDKSIAFSGPITSDGKKFVIAIVYARTGSFIRGAYGIGLAPTTPVQDLAGILEKSSSRTPSNSGVVTSANGMKTGGIYDALPSLADIPEGFTFSKDT